MGETPPTSATPLQSEAMMPGMATHRQNQRHAERAPAPAAPRNRYWPLLLIAAPAAVAIWSGWVGLGAMSGFGPVNLLPGIAGGVHVNTAITLPVGVESYGAFALWAWLAGQGSVTTRTFARRSAIGALVLGAAGQVAYHLLAAARWTTAPPPVVVLVACLPVVTLSFAAALVHLMRADTRDVRDAVAEREAKTARSAARSAVRSPVSSPADVPSQVPSQVPPQDAPEVPSEVPAAVPLRVSNEPDAVKARAAYRKSVRDGRPLSQAVLGAKYGKSKTWGRDRIREVSAGPQVATRTGT